MKSLFHRVDWSLFCAGQPAAYLLAVSGGADSVFLARAMADHAAAHARPWTLGIAHVNHGVRGAEADEDERFVAALAEELGLEFHAIRLDPVLLDAAGTAPDAADRLGAGTSLEGRLRLARWGGLAALARARQADAIVAAHNRDDLAETFLLQALRGAGLTGLASLQPRGHWEDVPIARPLLEIGAAEIREALQRNRFPWREDASNRDSAFKRNWLRNEILSLIEQREPGSRAALARTAAVCAEEIAELQQQALRDYQKIQPEIPRPRSPARAWRNDTLHALSPVLRRHVLRRCILEIRSAPLAPSREALLQLESAAQLSLADGEERFVTAIPGLLVWVSRAWILAGPVRDHAQFDTQQLHRLVLPWLRDWRALWPVPWLCDSPREVPRILLPREKRTSELDSTLPLGSAARLRVEVMRRDQLPPDWKDRWHGELRTARRILADAESLRGDCIARPAKADDRLSVFQKMGGTKCAGELLAEARIPQALRPLMPIVCDDNQPLGLPGIRRSTHANLTDASRLIVHMLFESA